MPKVLIVDDSEVDRRMAGGLVEMSLGATTVYATNGRDALEKIPQERPDVVITDLQMGGMNGLELTSAIKADHPLIPVILITSQGSEEIAARALQAGAASYVPKRRLAKDLPDTVQRILLGASNDREHSQLMHHMTDNESAFVFHNDPGLIQSLVRHLQEQLRCLPLGDETERLRVGIAIEEALQNAYLHGNLEIGASPDDEQSQLELARQRRIEPPYCQRRIHVRARISRDEAEFTIRDEGPGFDTSQLLDAADEQAHDEHSGRGIILMRTLMDEVSYNDIGNEVRLVKRRVDPPVEEPVDDEDDD